MGDCMNDEYLEIISGWAEITSDGFAIVSGWEALSEINDALNSYKWATDPDVWGIYRGIYLQYGSPKSPFDDLRLGHSVPYCPSCGSDRCSYSGSDNIFRCWDCRTRVAFVSFLCPPMARGELPTAKWQSGPYYEKPDELTELSDVAEWGFSDEYAACDSCNNHI